MENDVMARVIVGVLLFTYPAAFVAGLVWTLLAPSIRPGAGLTTVDPTQVNEALMVMLAGGVGSSVYAIRAYLKHACDLRDFSRDYVPWYVFRSIQGALLALIFYLVLRGGILVLTLNGEGQSSTELNVWALAATGALVGLFSKYAIEKLRQVFIITFTSKAELDEDEKQETRKNGAKPTKK
jgi:hypothetical protein